MEKNRWPGAITAAVLGAALIAWFAVASGRVAGPPRGFPLDDAWIHVRFAQNLAGHGSFAFNPGEPTAGATSPLWVVALAGASLITREFVVTALALGILSYLLLGVASFLATRKMLNDAGAGLAAAVIVLVNVRIVWSALSGMETCLASVLALAAAASFAVDEARRRPPAFPGDPTLAVPTLGTRLHAFAVPVLFGLASLARPEAHLLFALVVFLRVVRSCRRDTPVRELFRLIPFGMIAIYILVIAPWHVFALRSSGSPLPNTFRANYRGIATRVYPAGYYLYYARWLLVRDHPWIYWFVPLGLLVTVRETVRQRRAAAGQPSLLTPFGLALAQLAALWVVCYPIASRLILPMTRHYARYMIPMTPFHAILSVLGIWAVAQLVATRFLRKKTSEDIPTETLAVPTDRSSPRRHVFAVVLSCAIALSAFSGLKRWVEVYGHNVYSINHQHVAMAEWVRDHTPAGSVIAAHDVGALGAISDHYVLDLFGLVTPSMIRATYEIIPTRENMPFWYLEQLLTRKAAYVIGYPDWLPFLSKAPGCFEEVHREVLTKPDICGGLEMIAYRIDAEKLREVLSRQ